MNKIPAKAIKEILSKGTSVELRSQNYMFTELLDFAVCTRSTGTSKLTLIVGDNLSEDELLTLASVARRNLKLIMS